MHKGSIYRKTGKGAEAITNRDRALQPRQRSVLILVDGKRTMDELLRMAPAGFEESLEQLAQLGMIELVEGSAAPATPAQPQAQAVSSAPAPLRTQPAPLRTQPGGTVPLAQAQRFAVRRLSDMLGPVSDDLCMRIERTKSANEFEAMLQRAVQFLDASLGSARAREFAQAMEDHRPA